MDSKDAMRTRCGKCTIGISEVPTLKDKMSRGKRPIEYVDDISWEESADVELVELHMVEHSREAKVIESGTAEEKAAIFYENYLKGRLEEL